MKSMGGRQKQKFARKRNEKSERGYKERGREELANESPSEGTEESQPTRKCRQKQQLKMCQTTVHTTGPPRDPPPLLRFSYPSAFLHCNPQQSVQKRRVKEFAVIKQFCTDATLLGVSLALITAIFQLKCCILFALISGTQDPLPLCLRPFPTLRECKLKFYEWLQISWNQRRGPRRTTTKETSWPGQLLKRSLLKLYL